MNQIQQKKNTFGETFVHKLVEFQKKLRQPAYLAIMNNFSMPPLNETTFLSRAMKVYISALQLSFWRNT